MTNDKEIKELVDENNYLRLMMFMLIKNTAVMPIGMKLGKSESEINQMAYGSMEAYLGNEIEPGVLGLDLKKCQERYDEGKRLHMESKGEKLS